MRKSLLIIFCVLVGESSMLGQPQPGSLRGTLVDSLSGTALAFASVSLLPLGQDTLLGGGLTDERGRFSLRDLGLGTYRLRAQALGYAPRWLDSLALTPTQISLDLGEIRLSLAAYEAEAVEITGERPFQELAPDRRIYRVANLAFAEHGTAPDVLRQIPSLTVDMDGALALRGDGQVALFIDGRPSPLTGSARAAFLAQLAAASIERVEVITTPSARFDPEGTAGIINIVLKKDLRQGFSGNLNLMVGTRHKYQGSTLLNYRTRAFNLALNYTYRYEQRFALGSDMRAQPGVKQPAFVDQENDLLRRTATHFFNPILDLYLSPRQTLTIGTIFNPRTLRTRSTRSFEFRDLDQVTYQRSARQTEGLALGKIFDFDLDYDKRFAQEGRSLYVYASYAVFSEQIVDEFTQIYQDLMPLGLPGDSREAQRLSQDRPFSTLTLVADYVHPLPREVKLETGFQAKRRTFANDYQYLSLVSLPGSLLPDTSLDFDFSYLETVYAAYATLSGKLAERWQWQSGLRAEQVYTLGTPTPSAATDTFTNDYFRLFPSAYLTYRGAKRREWQFSYSRRINRPNFDAVNPFPAYHDPYYLILGNPALLPEDIHSGELTFSQRVRKVSLTAALYGRHVSQVTRRVQATQADGIARATYLNNPSALSAGAELIGSGRLTKWWTGNATLNLFYVRYTLAGGGPAGEGLGWQLQALSNFRLPQGVMIQVSGHYRGPRPILQGQLQALGWLDLAVRKSLFKRKGAITLRVSDVFNTLAYTQELRGLDFEQTRYRNLETQIAYLSFSYRFGKPVRRSSRATDSDEGRGAGSLRETDIE